MIVATAAKIQPFVWISLLNSGKADKFRHSRELRPRATLNYGRNPDTLPKVRRLVPDLFCIMFRGAPARYFPLTRT